MKPFFKSPQISESCNSRDRLLRVADILKQEEDVGDCAGNFDMADIGESRHVESPSPSTKATVPCLSPRRIIARFAASFRRRKERRDAKEKEPMNGVDCGHPSSFLLDNVESGRSKRDASFNLGVGCSLLYLVLASKDELSKMVDLRKQMENFLQDVKEELQRKDNNLFEPFKSNTDMVCSSSDFREGPCSTSQLSYQQDFSSQILSDSQSTVPNHSVKSCLHEQDNREDVIDELEAEFEAELELLQLHFELGSSSKRREQLRIKTAKNSNSTRSYCMSSGEVIDPQEGDTENNHGVSPIALERRLHELLEARQQEQINELEGALECAKQEVIDKESEISWWKETAKVISQHVPAHSRLKLGSQHDQLFK